MTRRLVIAATALATVGALVSAVDPPARATPASVLRTGPEPASIQLDPATGTVRMAMRSDGTLTAPSDRPAAAIATDFLHAHLDELGLIAADLDTLQLARDYRDIGGTHHLFWTQQIAGREVDNGGLRAAVTGDGRLLMVTGSPISHLAPPASGSDKEGEIDSARAALAVARGLRGDGAARRRPVQAAPGETAVPVLHADADGHTRSAWEVLLTAGSDAGLSLLDAGTGGLIERQVLVADESDPGVESPATYFPYYPNAPAAPSQVVVDLTAAGWLGATATTLNGNNTHAYADLNDDDTVTPNEEVGPREGHAWDYPFTPFTLPDVSFCDRPIPCAWDPDTPFSWRTNLAQNVTQVFATVNIFHDHLLAAPIGFTEAAGNFEKVNADGEGKGGDAVRAQALDGAARHGGLPDYAHSDNANMFTPPEGHPPTMQMYLNHEPGTTYPDGDAFAPTNGGDGSDTIYHEYTHGLSTRLVVNARGRSMLGIQGDAMGEGWSDWYAMDYLVDENLQPDDPAVADIFLFRNDTNHRYLERTEPLDCRVGDTDPACRGGSTGHTGGYTLRDYAHVIEGGAEPHADGEIWAQTLWDVRRAVGSDVAESLVTRAMELSPNPPTFLDMRNAILLADTANYAGAHTKALWTAFAARGMGYLAGFLGDDDETPAADFSTPSDHSGTGYLHGRVLDRRSGGGIQGATVRLALSAPGVGETTATTDSHGRYRIGPVPRGTYRKVEVEARHYARKVLDHAVVASGHRLDIRLRAR